MVNQEVSGELAAEFSVRKGLIPGTEQQKVEEYIGAIEWLLEAVRREVRGLQIFGIMPDSYRDAVAVLFVKATSHLMAILTLIKAGYGIEACGLARSLINLTIDLSYMNKIGEGEENAARFFDYGWILAYRDLERVRDLHKRAVVDDNFRNGYERNAAHVIKKFEGVKHRFTVEEKGGKHRLARHWSKHEGLADRARELGDSEYGTFQLAYARLSEVEHSVGSEMLRYKRFPKSGGTIEYIAGPNPKELTRPLITGLRYYIDAFNLFGQTFGINTRPYTDKVQQIVAAAESRAE